MIAVILRLILNILTLCLAPTNKELTMRICSFVVSTTVDFKSNSQDVIEIQSFSLIEGFNKNIALTV